MARSDAKQVRQAATGRWLDILSAVGAIPREILDGQHHPCPKCAGTDRFRMIDEAAGAVLCNNCFNKKNGDGIAAVGWALGVDFKVALDRIRTWLGLDQPGERDPMKDLEPRDWVSDLVAFYVAAKPGVTEESLLANGARMFQFKRHYAVIGWPIIGEDLDTEKPVGWVIADLRGGQLPKWDKQGNVIGKLNSKLTFGSKPGFLGTWAIERIKAQGLVQVCWKAEGVTDLHAIWAKIPASDRDRHVVISNANGAEEKPSWRAGILARLPMVPVIQDADEPGQAGSVVWCQEIAGHGGHAKHVKLPYEVVATHGKDVRDWFAEGNSYVDLLALADKALEHDVARTADGLIDATAREWPIQERILKTLQLEVLYENEAGAVRVFSSALRKSSWIRQVDRLKIEGLIQACGPPAMLHVSADPKDSENEFSLVEVRRAIALVASTRREQQNERGIGIWQGVDDGGHESDSLVLVGDTEAARWNGSRELSRVLSPRSDGLVFDYGAGRSDWFDFVELDTLIKQAGDPAWAKDVINACLGILGRWRWRNEASPLLVTGLVMATWVQSIWTWRPLVAITGESNAGKSLLFDALGGNQWRLGMFGHLAFKQSKSTEAGLRQGVGNTARIVLCDEFEKGGERDRILEMLRLSTRGDQTARGNASGIGGKSYGLRHIGWIAAIESGLERQPDVNRFVHLELLTARKGEQGRLKLPENGELYRLGQKLLALAVYHGLAAKKVADRIKETVCEGIDGRTVEVFAVPAAILASCLGGDQSKAEKMLRELLTVVEADSQGSSDHEELLGDILTASLGQWGKQMSVGQVLDSPALWQEHASALEAAGVTKRPSDDGSEKLVIATKMVKSRLLKGTAWEKQRIDQILLRMPGATKQRTRMAGSFPWTIRLPMPEEQRNTEQAWNDQRFT
jgi:hypothetical protein